MDTHYNICLFPGQGSQHTGMGADLFPLFPDYVDQANTILGYDVREICLSNPDNRLHQTNYTQPAIFVVNTLSYLKYVAENGRPDVVLGHSLGESNALLAAEVFDFETGLKIVQRRGAIMAAIKNGGMAAVLGLDQTEVREILDAHFPALDLANINARQQIVISGQAGDIETAAPVFEDAFASYIPLNVSGAFHSRYMVPAREAFAQDVRGFRFNQPQIPVIANVTARPYEAGQLPDLLIEQITSPVRWLESIQYLLAQGDCTFYETGPGQVLTNLVGKIRRDAE